MSDFKSPCGCTIHVIQWTSKRKIASVKNCPMHKAAKELLGMLKEAVDVLGDASWNGRDKTLALIAKAEGRQP